MMFPRYKEVLNMRKRYPSGSRVELLKMDDVQAPPIGTNGTVLCVNDTGSIFVAWDNGSRLNVIYGEDEVRKISQQEGEKTK